MTTQPEPPYVALKKRGVVVELENRDGFRLYVGLLPKKVRVGVLKPNGEEISFMVASGHFVDFLAAIYKRLLQRSEF